MEDDLQSFVQQIGQFLIKCPGLKIVCTSRKHIGNHDDFTENKYHLHTLSPQASVKLLLGYTKRVVTNQEIQDLLKYEIPDDYKLKERFPAISKDKLNMTTHPLTMILGGHPQAISLAGPMLDHQPLLSLFKQLISSSVEDLLHPNQNSSVMSLKLSTQMSIDNIQNSYPEALELLKILGLLPGGIYENELDELLGDDEWASSKLKLIEASIIAYNHAKKKLSILPFMTSRACQLLESEPDKKNDLHLKCCNFYIKFLQTFTDKIVLGKFNLNEFVEREENIWACIYRGINRKKDNDDFDIEDKIESPSSGLKRSLSLSHSIEDSKTLITDSVLRKVNAKRKHTVIQEELSLEDEQSDSEEEAENFTEHSSFSASSSSSDDFDPIKSSYFNTKFSTDVKSKNKVSSDPKALKSSKSNIKPQKIFKLNRSLSYVSDVKKNNMMTVDDEEHDIFTQEEQLVCYYI